jgi:hypothetical protein
MANLTVSCCSSGAQATCCEPSRKDASCGTQPPAAARPARTRSRTAGIRETVPEKYAAAGSPSPKERTRPAVMTIARGGELRFEAAPRLEGPGTPSGHFRAATAPP